MKQRHEELLLRIHACIREKSEPGVLAEERHANAERVVRNLDLAMHDPNKDVLQEAVAMLCKELIKPGVLQ